jgi:uncharacterized UBP type Zn finger protein
MKRCTHTDQVHKVPLPEERACEDCVKAGRRDWVHLRQCLSCGHVGCCDSSPGRHATAHHRYSDHPIVRSLEPGESWAWCYVDQLVLEVR